MIEMQPLTETALARDVLKRLSDPSHILTRAARVLKVVAHSSVGLGGVLQDYAAQSCGQLQEVIEASSRVSHDMAMPSDKDTLRNIHFILKSARAILERVPAGMSRNKADCLGDKKKLSRADITEITHALLSSPDVAPLLADEKAGEAFVALVAEDSEALMAPGQDRMRAAAGH